MRKTVLFLAAGVLAGAMAAAPVFAASAPGTTLDMVATAYGPTAQDNYPYGATDYFGQPLTQGDIAVDPSVIPLKTCLYVTGYSSPYLPAGGYIGEADDEGDAIQGDRVDLYYNGTESQINQFGIQNVQVTILGKPTNPSASGTAACAGYANAVASGTFAGSQGNQGTSGTPAGQGAFSSSTGSTASGGPSSTASSGNQGSLSGSTAGQTANGTDASDSASSTTATGATSTGNGGANGASGQRHFRHHRWVRWMRWMRWHHAAAWRYDRS